MDTDKCRVLLNVLETGNFSKTAQQLGYTPSGVSRMMNALEEETGFKLLYRSKYGIHATLQCESLLPIIRELAHWSDQYYETAEALLGLKRGHLTIGVSNPFDYSWLTPIFREFHEEYPDVKMRFIEDKSTNLYHALNEYRADLCIVSKRSFDTPFKTLKREEMVAWIPTSHPLAKKKSITLDVFEEETYISTFGDEDTDNTLIFKNEGITPNMKFSTSGSYSTWCLVEAGLGISMEGENVASQWSGHVVIRPLSPRRYVDVGVIFHDKSYQSPATQKFLEFIEDYQSEE